MSPEIDIRCRFHQCSTCSFYKCKLRAQFFCAYVLGLYFTGINLLAQKLCVERWWNWPQFGRGRSGELIDFLSHFIANIKIPKLKVTKISWKQKYFNLGHVKRSSKSDDVFNIFFVFIQSRQYFVKFPLSYFVSTDILI